MEICDREQGTQEYELQIDIDEDGISGSAVLRIGYTYTERGTWIEYGNEIPPEWILSNFSFMVTKYSAAWHNADGTEEGITTNLPLNEDLLYENIETYLYEN